MNSNKRIVWVDYSKVFLIYLVVLAHYGRINSNIDVLICAFHMPAFFFISGYLHKTLPFNECLRKNAKRLLVPAFLFSCLCLIPALGKIILKEGGTAIINSLGKFFLGFLIHNKEIALIPCRVIWFLEVLFLCFILLDYLERQHQKMLFLVVLVCISAVALWRYYGINDYTYIYFLQRTCASFPFVCLGFFAKKMNLVEKMLAKYKNRYLPLLLIPLYVTIAIYNGRVGIASWRFGNSLLIYYITAILGCICMIIITSHIKNEGGKIVKDISNGTIVILCLHSQFIWCFHHLGIPPYIGSLIIVIVCVPLIRLFEKRFIWFTGKF